jgi:predicted nucleotidyltransferase
MDMQDDWLPRLCSWANANDSVLELWLFGSRAQGSSRTESDVDLALVLTPPKGKENWALQNWFSPTSDKWKPQLEGIVRRNVDLEVMLPGAPGPDYDSMVRCFGVRLWTRSETTSNPVPLLILKRASASRLSGQWNDDDYDVACRSLLVTPGRE